MQLPPSQQLATYTDDEVFFHPESIDIGSSRRPSRALTVLRRFMIRGHWRRRG